MEAYGCARCQLITLVVHNLHPHTHTYLLPHLISLCPHSLSSFSLRLHKENIYILCSGGVIGWGHLSGLFHAVER